MPNIHTLRTKHSHIFNNKAWAVWGIAAVFYAFQFMLRVSPGVLANDLMRDFQIDACALGLLTACYYYSYSFLQVPAGALMDRLKPRKMMTFAAILCSSGCLLFASSTDLFTASIGRAMIGAGSAFAFLSCLKLATLWFPSRKLPLVVGLTLCLGTMGAISASSPLAWLSDIVGWRSALWTISFLGFTIAACGWLFIRDYPCEVMKADHAEQQQDMPWYKSVSTVATNPQCWLIGIYGGLMYVPLSAFADLWGVPFLMSKYNISNASAGFASALFYVGIGIGAPLFSYVTGYFKAFRPAIQLSAFVGAIFFLIAIYTPGLSFTITSFCLLLAGLSLGGQFLAFSITVEINPSYASGTAGGFHNMICMMSGVITQPLIGWILKSVWTGEYVDGIPNYTLGNYQVALCVIPVALILATIIPWLIREVYVTSSDEAQPVDQKKNATV